LWLKRRQMVFTRIIERKFIEGISGTGHTHNAGSVKKNYEIVPKIFLCSESLGRPVCTAPPRECFPSRSGFHLKPCRLIGTSAALYDQIQAEFSMWRVMVSSKG
jgi:hypothetical protein